MKEQSEKINELARGFAASSEILIAIGDETRMHIILEMLKLGKCEGVRVGEITEMTNLSRPAVSHHLRIMKNAGILKMRKEGTKNYYYFEPDQTDFARLIDSLNLALEISRSLPNRSGEDV